MATRIGPKMREVVAMVERSSGKRRTRIDVAEDVGPHGSLQYGYAIVARAVAVDLVRLAPPLPGRRGMSLVLPPGKKGKV